MRNNNSDKLDFVTNFILLDSTDLTPYMDEGYLNGYFRDHVQEDICLLQKTIDADAVRKLFKNGRVITITDDLGGHRNYFVKRKWLM